MIPQAYIQALPDAVIDKIGEDLIALIEQSRTDKNPRIPPIPRV
jgi:adenylate kinase